MNGLELFLDSIRLSPPGAQWSFFWNKRFPGAIAGSIGFDFYIDFDKKNRAAFLLVRKYPELLGGLSINKVGELLDDFFESSISEIGVDSMFFAAERNKTILELTSQNTIFGLDALFENFIKNKLQNSVFVMPVSGVPCLAQKTEGNLLWVPCGYSFSSIVDGFGIPEQYLQSHHFPPFADHDKYRKYPLTDEDSWFIVKANDESVAESCLRRMAGALSVILKYPHSRNITGRQVIDGRVEFRPNGSCGFNFKTSLVPAVALPLYVKDGAENLFWGLCREEAGRRIHICLEYMAESWGKSRIISFINTSIAMDALFGVNGRVRQSILEGVETNCTDISYARNRYDLILKIRNDILHGECPSLEASSHYLDYYDQFNSDPAGDQIRIINDCLSKLAE